MLHKTSPFEFKSLDDAGTFEATVAVFGNVDKGGDRILRGAFKNTLEAWKASGDPIPVIFNHDWGTPDAHIGVVDEAMETEKGLFVKGRLDVDDNPVAKQVHRLMQRRSLKEFSFGYSVPKGGEKRAKDGANELSMIDLAEVGPTLKGMNPATELHAVKSAVEAAKAEDGDQAKQLEELRRETRRLTRELDERTVPKGLPAPKTEDQPSDEHLELAKWLRDEFGPDARTIFEKAVWTAAYINDLPDSAFLYVEPGGSKDSEGKTTPRNLRHFPYKDQAGAVDLPHLRNALSRIPQSSLSQDVKDRLTAKAQRILDGLKAVSESDPGRRTQSGERKAHEALALQVATGFRDVPQPPRQVEEPQVDPEAAKALRRQTRDLLSDLLTQTGVQIHEPL